MKDTEKQRAERLIELKDEIVKLLEECKDEENMLIHTVMTLNAINSSAVMLLHDFIGKKNKRGE